MDILENDLDSKINNEIKEETTFNKLKELQTLLKKESALKGLYSETGKNTQKDIETLCKDIFSKRIDVLNAIKNEPNSNNINKYELIKDNKEYLKALYIYIPKLLDYLWENPLIISKILINSSKTDIQTYLAPLFCNNFYENIISPNYIEDQLMYIIYLLLEDEIAKINNVNEYRKFLNGTPCGFLLDELIDKKDIKSFFKILFQDIIEIMELSSGDGEIILDSFFIEQKITNKINNQKKISMKNIPAKRANTCVFFGESKNTSEEKKQHDMFIKNYLLSYNLKKLKELKNKYNLENNKSMENYIDLQLRGQTNEEIYTNSQFIALTNKDDIFLQMLMEYQKSFYKVTNFIDSLLKSFLENLDLLPYSIRCVCKIISTLLDKKFKDITPVEKNLFISQFFIYKLFIPILINPASGALINNYIISGKTLKNLNSISQILIQFLSFKLYKSEEKPMHTPFNPYFFNNVDKLMKIYDNLTKVKLPSFISKLINGDIDRNIFEFNYFNENKNEIVFHRSFFLTVNHLKSLLKSINDLKKIIYNKENSGFQAIINKLVNNEDNLKFLTKLCKDNEATNKITTKANKSKGEKKEEKNIKYFLINDLVYNEKYKKLFNLKNDYSYFKLEEKKITNINDNKDNKEIIENIIISTKNTISTLLYNYRSLTEIDFQEKEMENTWGIFKKLKLLMKSSDLVVDDRIPSDWYIELLFEKLKKLPPEYKEKDFEKLYEELKQDIEKSIKQYNFEELSLIIDKKKFAKKIKAYYNNTKEITQDIHLNKGVKSIFENDEINVKLFFKYNDERKELNIYQEDVGDKQLDFLDSFIFVDVNQKARLCKTIESFTKTFPDLNRYLRTRTDDNIFDIEKRLEVPKHLSTFFNIIKSHLKKKMKDEKQINIIYDRVYDYVMSKIHHKIFPPELDALDITLYKKMQAFSWIEPNNLMKNNYNYNFELILPEITKCFNYINIEKSPRKKILNMNKIFESINSLLTFTENSQIIGVDNQMPLLNYIFIKAKPKGMYTNLEFMELYMGEKIKKIEGNNLAQLKSIRDFTFNLNPENLQNVSNEEFEYNCKNSIIEE